MQRANAENNRYVSPLAAAFSAVGTISGAGFLSGRELLEFIGGFFLFPLLLLFIAFFAVFFSFFSLGVRYGGFHNALHALFSPRTEKIARAAIAFSAFIVGFVTLSSFHVAYPSARPYLAVLVCVLAVCCTARGTSAVHVLGKIVVPVLVLSLFCSALKGGVFSPPQSLDALCSAHRVFPCLAYVSMNAFFSSPVLIETGARLKSKRGVFFSALAAAFFLFCLAALVLSAIGFDKSSYASPFPLEYVLGVKAFSFFSLIGICTTFFSCFCSVCTSVGGGIKGKSLCGLFFFLCSLLPFVAAVKYAYPLVGCIGVLIASLGCVDALLRHEKSRLPVV